MHLSLVVPTHQFGRIWGRDGDLKQGFSKTYRSNKIMVQQRIKYPCEGGRMAHTAIPGAKFYIKSRTHSHLQPGIFGSKGVNLTRNMVNRV